MSKDVIVLAPNGRRQKVHCKPDTNILQILEDVCQKQGFQSTEYDLKHHNNVLDLSTTIRFSNLPNKATLEMVEADRKREESNVTVGLQLEDGERRTANFTPNTSLYELIMTLAPEELNHFTHPTILYMRQEVIGLIALKDKTLRQLGLIQGRAILRLLNKAEETKQANVSAVYRVPIKEELPMPTKSPSNNAENPSNAANPSNAVNASNAVNPSNTANASNVPTTSNFEEKTSEPTQTSFHENIKNFDPLKFLKHEMHSRNVNKKVENIIEEESITSLEVPKEEPMEVDQKAASVEKVDPSQTSLMAQQTLERRLKIEEEVTFLGTQKAIAFMQPDVIEEELDDLPNDFYELTIEEVRKLYHQLHQQRLEYENTPLMTSSKRDQLQAESSQQKLNQYKNVVVRIQFPDRMILQGVFEPNNTIEHIANFVKEHLQTPNRTFQMFTTPFKETLDYKKTLAEAGFVPGVHMHFKWADDSPDQTYLKKEIYAQTTNSDAASLLASKYRAPSRRKEELTTSASQNSNAVPSTSKSSKLPKWFKV